MNERERERKVKEGDKRESGYENNERRWEKNARERERERKREREREEEREKEKKEK